MKKLIISAFFLAATPLAFAAISHGSIIMKDQPLYDQHSNADFDPSTKTPIDGKTTSIKIVTVGDKTFVWTGSSQSIGGATWASQFRTYTPGKAEHNLLGRSSDNKETFGSFTYDWVVGGDTDIDKDYKISVFHDMGGFVETAIYLYNPTKANSNDPTDNVAPVLANATPTEVTSFAATINMDGSDNSGDLFYILTDEQNGLAEVSFSNSITITVLPDVSYNITVTPVDFNGNEGTPIVVNFSTAGTVQVTNGIAKDIRFVLNSTNDVLEYYYEFRDSEKIFYDAFLKYTVDGNTKEVKPTVSPDRKYCYGKVTDQAITGKILNLNMGYLEYTGEPIDWGSYVMENSEITEGELAGTPVIHQMGGTESAEQIVPVLTKAVLVDVTTDMVTFEFEGSDDSGVIYYEVNDGTNSTNFYRTGLNYATDFLAGNLYDLRVVAKDLSGNTSPQEIQIKLKTANARSSIVSGNRLNYNTTQVVADDQQGGEIAVYMDYEIATNSLTIGVTTRDNQLQANRINYGFYTAETVGAHPIVEVNGVEYPLTDRLDSELEETYITQARTTFTDKIGDLEIEENMTMKLKWAVSWNENGGRFFTGVYTYVLGDDGSEDVTPPSKPELVVSGAGTTYKISWLASTDNRSGVKGYEISINQGTPYILFNYGEASYELSSLTENDEVSITAIDYAGNRSEAAVAGEGVQIDTNKDNAINIFVQNAQLTIEGKDAVNVQLYNLSGVLLSETATNTIDVSNLSTGVYLVKVIDQDNQTIIRKVFKN